MKVILPSKSARVHSIPLRTLDYRIGTMAFISTEGDAPCRGGSCHPCRCIEVFENGMCVRLHHRGLSESVVGCDNIVKVHLDGNLSGFDILVGSNDYVVLMPSKIFEEFFDNALLPCQSIMVLQESIDRTVCGL